jgi:hypothetical protein
MPLAFISSTVAPRTMRTDRVKKGLLGLTAVFLVYMLLSNWSLWQPCPVVSDIGTPSALPIGNTAPGSPGSYGSQENITKIGLESTQGKRAPVSSLFGFYNASTWMTKSTVARRKVKGFIDHPYCALGLLMLLSMVLSDCDRTRLVSGRRPAHQSGAGGSIAACWRECTVGSETACD